MTVRSVRTAAALLALCVASALAGCTTPGDPPPPTPRSPSPTVTTTSLAPPVTQTAPSPPTSGAPPPYIARVAWVSDTRGRILRVYPTPAGRVAALAGATEAWAEVLRYAADAGSPGMAAQFDCHWTFARIVEPDKSSWNLEPWRPVVSPAELQRSRCNPGGAEETVPAATGG